MLGYELARRRLDVGAALAEQAPRPVIVQTDGSSGDSSALSILLMPQLLPQVSSGGAPAAERSLPTPSISRDATEELAQRAAQAVQGNDG
ncbi:hypothetical protein [Janibacter melonis]|uniref:hypothetical protein n=1 Tax=Janibacter melonis TaxID=262209 RepID=UPI002095CA3F|nr:hypothetical protein [Janibacter melonis]